MHDKENKNQSFALEKQLYRKLSKSKTEATVQLIIEHIMFEALPIFNHAAVVTCANPSFHKFFLFFFF